MKPLRVELGERSYPIFFGSDHLGKLPEFLKLYRNGHRYAIVADRNVLKPYAETLSAAFADAGADSTLIPVEPGERSKSIEVWGKITRELVNRGADRSWAIVALGGGMVGDLAGFVAATYMRGIEFVQVPTTLLAQVDASVGGKVGINLPEGKNLAGAFHQPRAVWIDTGTLRTLPARELVCGVAEIIKHAIIRDRELFHDCENQLDGMLSCDTALLARIVAANCGIKAAIVSQDEREEGVRALLNFGHTVGHALENMRGYGHLLHGEAVLLGMLIEARIAVIAGLLAAAEFERIQRLLFRIPLKCDLAGIQPDKLRERMRPDKKARNGRLFFALPSTIGEARLVEVADDSQVVQALQYAQMTGWS